ncbi:MAG: rane protein of unknown function [Candidatus Saccharibacteria bacterium]|nr:rane protein of unknown function [Candidatus Saccharibacteria bacterium]
MKIKRPKISLSRLYMAPFMLAIALATLISVLGPLAMPLTAYAAGGAEYALYFPDTAQYKGQLKTSFKDTGGDIGSGTSAILNQTKLLTKGGFLGAQTLSLSAGSTENENLPIYKLDYYCTPSSAATGYGFSTEKPDGSKPYVRYTMGVALTDSKKWSGLADDPNYTTYVGVLGNTNVGTVHFPETYGSDGSYYQAKDFDLPGKAGDHNIRQAIEFTHGHFGHWYGNADGTDRYSFNDPRYGDTALPDYKHIGDVFDKCMPSPDKYVANKAINLSNHPEAAKEYEAALGTTLEAAASGSAGGSGTSGTGGESGPGLTCEVKFYNPLTWLLCPAVKGMVNIVGSLDDIITSQLSVGSSGNSSDPNQIFCSSKGTSNSDAQRSCKAYENAWKSVRNIALGLMVIVGLIIVVAQVLGMEILDAYAIKKTLPRLIIAAIAITLSWKLMQFFVTFTNDLGYGVRYIIYRPFSDSGFDQATLGGGGSVATSIAGYTALQALGIFGLLSFAATAALAVFVAFMVLVIRQLLIIVLIIFAPIAIIAFILPNTNKVYKLWWDSFSKALLMFPIIAAFIATGRVFAAVSATSGSTLGQFVGFAAYFAPYFLLPLTFKFAGGALGNIGGFVNNSSKGGFDRLKKFRSGQFQSHGGRKIEGANRQVLAGRAGFNNRLQDASSKSNNRFVKAGLGRLASTTAGYNLEALQSAKTAQVAKEVNDQIATGRDEEVRGLLIDKKTAQSRDDPTGTGKRQYKSLGGAWVDEAHVDAGQRRWGNDKFAKQAALAYEMRKTDTVDDVEHLKKNYGKTALASGMTEGEAAGAWIGAAFENQNQHLEMKHTNWKDGSMSETQASKFASEAYEKKGSYAMSQMHASTIKQLGKAYDLGGDELLNGNEEEAIRGGRTQNQVAAVAETFVNRFGGGAAGGPGDDPAIQAALAAQQRQAAAVQQAQSGGGAYPAGGQLLGPDGKPISRAPEATISVNTPGAAHVAEEVFDLAIKTGVKQAVDPTTARKPDISPPSIPRQSQ